MSERNEIPLGFTVLVKWLLRYKIIELKW